MQITNVDESYKQRIEYYQHFFEPVSERPGW